MLYSLHQFPKACWRISLMSTDTLLLHPGKTMCGCHLKLKKTICFTIQSSGVEALPDGWILFLTEFTVRTWSRLTRTKTTSSSSWSSTNTSTQRLQTTPYVSIKHKEKKKSGQLFLILMGFFQLLFYVGNPNFSMESCREHMIHEIVPCGQKQHVYGWSAVVSSMLSKCIRADLFPIVAE